MEADIICSVLVMRYLSGRNTCFLSLANVYLAVCGLTRTLQPAFSPVRFRLLSMFPTSPTGNRDSSKNMIERTAVALFFLPIPFFYDSLISIPVCCHMEYYGNREQHTAQNMKHSQIMPDFMAVPTPSHMRSKSRYNRRNE